MPEIILPLLWPPNLPDLNPVDYGMWSVLQEKVHKTCITDIDYLKHSIRTEWPKLDYSAAVCQWRHCLSECVILGGHLEQCF